MENLNLNDLKNVNGSWYIPFYRERYSDQEFWRCNVWHVHNVFSPDLFICKEHGKYKNIGRRKAEAKVVVLS